MIVALLVLIILILLFGAAAVKGWIRSTLVAILGFAAIATVLIWLGSFFGEDGFLYVLLTIVGLCVALGLLGLAIDAKPPAPPPPSRPRRKGKLP